MITQQTYRNGCRGFNQKLTGNDPASQFQRQKHIQNTIKVPSSLYTMNLAGLTCFQNPATTRQMVKNFGSPYIVPTSVNWNQMSDRAFPSNQTVKTGSGSTYRGSSTSHTILRDRPGAMSPGGLGVDIKHNSYERRLHKLKGKSILKQDTIPSNYGTYIYFNRANPVYGGKTIKTSISTCSCKKDTNQLIYMSSQNAIQDQLLNVRYTFHIGDWVWVAKVKNSLNLYKSQIMDIVDDVYTVQFMDETTRETSVDELHIYFNCNCNGELSVEEKILNSRFSANNASQFYSAYTELACQMLGKVNQD